jgi:hypothetical protein
VVGIATNRGSITDSYFKSVQPCSRPTKQWVPGALSAGI